MKNNHSHSASRVRVSTASIVVLLLASALGAAIEPPGLKDQNGPSKRIEWQVLIETYAETDWKLVAEYLESHPNDPLNVEIMAIPLALGSSYFERYALDGNPSDFEKALEFFQWIVDRSEVWEGRPSSSDLVGFLALAVDRVRGDCRRYAPLPNVSGKRVAVLWKRVKRILGREVDLRFAPSLNETPFFSCFAGKRKAEENASLAALFATAASFLADDPRAPAWEEIARLLAYDTIVRPSDQPDKNGRKTCTVSEDLTLWSDEATLNPQDTSRVLYLLTAGALAYHVTENGIPEEFTHNVRALHLKYMSYFTKDVSRLRSIAQNGDPRVFPLPVDPAPENQAPRERVVPGLLMLESMSPVSGAADLWMAIQDSKEVLDKLVRTDFWKATPSESPCYEVRFKEPRDLSR